MITFKNFYAFVLSTLFLIITSTCDKNEANKPTACFEFYSESIDNGDPAVVGETIEFANCSNDADSYQWNFGDGNISTGINPRHSYDAPGSYTVTLEVKNGNGTDRISREIDIQANMTGLWEGELDLYGNSYGLVFNIEQDGNSLSGYFEFSDGSGHTSFNTGCQISGQNVTISFVIYEESMSFSFTGIVNSSFDEMEGSYTVTIPGYNPASGNWFASKTAKKSTSYSISNKGLEFFTKQLILFP